MVYIYIYILYIIYILIIIIIFINMSVVQTRGAKDIILMAKETNGLYISIIIIIFINNLLYIICRANKRSKRYYFNGKRNKW